MFTSCPPNQSILTWRVPTMYPNDHEHKLAFLCPAHAKQHASLDFSLVGTDHGLATAMIIGHRVDFPGATTPFSINCCYQNIWLRFGLTKFICMPVITTAEWQARKGEEGSLHEITVAGKADSESICSSRVHRSGKVAWRWKFRPTFGDDSTSSLAFTRSQMTDRSIFIRTITTAGSDAIHHYNMDNLGEIDSKLLMIWKLLLLLAKNAFDMHQQWIGIAATSFFHSVRFSPFYNFFPQKICSTDFFLGYFTTDIGLLNTCESHVRYFDDR